MSPPAWLKFTFYVFKCKQHNVLLLQFMVMVVFLIYGQSNTYLSTNKYKGDTSMANEQIRSEIANARLRMWEVAERVGISSSQFSVWLRTPLSSDHRQRVEKAISQLTQEVKQ